MVRKKATPKDVAAWMATEVQAGNYLYQETCAWQIIEKFGEEFTYDNENYNKAIRKDVLAEFLTLTKDTVVWLRRERCWRQREEWDLPGRSH